MRLLFTLFIQYTDMKTLKNIILCLAALSMVFGGLNFTFGQEDVLFSETYPVSTITSHLESGDLLFRLVDREESNPESSIIGVCNESDTQILWSHLSSQKVRDQLPDDVMFAWGRSSTKGTKSLYALRNSDPGSIPGKQDISSVVIREDHENETFDLMITFSGKGAEKWKRMTRDNVGREIAILVNGEVVSAPKVQMEIKFGKCRISGDFDKYEAGAIKRALEK